MKSSDSHRVCPGSPLHTCARRPCPWETCASGLGVLLPGASPHHRIQQASQVPGSWGPCAGLSSFAKPQHLNRPIHYLQGSFFQVGKGPGRKEAWVLGLSDRRCSRFCFWAFRLPGPPSREPRASTPGPARPELRAASTCRESSSRTADAGPRARSWSPRAAPQPYRSQGAGRGGGRRR